MSGGLIILWNARNLDVVWIFRGSGFLGVKVIWMEKLYYTCNVYSSCCLSLKRDLWNNMLVLKDGFNDGEWLIGGDFNAFKNRGERNGRTAVGNHVK